MIPSWRKQIASYEFNALHVTQYPGWEKDPKTQQPYTHSVLLKKDRTISSYELACAIDSQAEGCFYYRDFTKDNLPTVGEGEPYTSTFVFQFKADYERFQVITENEKE